MKVLGIDPGTHKTGWGCIDGDRVNYGSFHFGVTRPRGKMPLPERLAYIYDELQTVCRKCSPDVIVCEDAFLAKDIRAAVNLGRAWAMAAARQIHHCWHLPKCL